MLPDQMEAEKNRKIILSQANEIDMLKNNVQKLQNELQNAYKRIAQLVQNKS